DDQGSDITWETIHRGPGYHLWYADGKIRPAKLLPLVPVKALVAIRHREFRDADGERCVQHQAHLYVQTDSKSAALVTRMLGSTTQQVAEQGLAQLQLFFSGLSWYLERYPERAAELLEEME
ncbi:MAG: hypothetical protein NZO58_02090, partial [Gemmataceae bacterium]|nr:hypothetical protein [Gemmataceae bacterium]